MRDRSNGRLRQPSPVLLLMMSVALALVGNLAANTVQVAWRWWPVVTWAGTIGLVFASLALELARNRPDVVGGLDRDADRLADVVERQWEAELESRRLYPLPLLAVRWRTAKLAVAGPVEAATTPSHGGPLLDPIPGLKPVDAAGFRDGTIGTLHDLYGGLASGRLIIAGEAGTGKTTAAVLLALDALAFRKKARKSDRRRIPVPVIVTMSGWDPRAQKVPDLGRREAARTSAVCRPWRQGPRVGALQ